ncbi:relaxase/mobilization nuclease domain-containing protein [Methylobacterium sp. M6A4_1b]
MISGATRGQGLGDGLARHLTNAENDEVILVAARGLASMDLAGQIRELVAISMGGRTDRPVYHVHADPDPSVADGAGARALFWSLFETEFGLHDQPYCGVEHVKGGRRHEHRVYSLVRPDGSVVDLAWDYPRREKCSRIVEHAHGVPPVPSKHARAIERRLRAEGRHDIAEWLVRAGATTAARPIAPLTPTERLIQDRTGILLDDLRRSALAAWRASDDAASFVAALQARGLDLREGRVGAVIVDRGGTAHLATRLIGAAARRLEGSRIPAAVVRARLTGFEPKDKAHGYRDRAPPRQAGPGAGRHPGGIGANGSRDGGIGLRRPGGGPGRPDGSGRGRDGRGAGAAIGRLRALPAGRSLIVKHRLANLDISIARYDADVGRARSAAERLEAERAYENHRAWALWGLRDIWGLPLT